MEKRQRFDSFCKAFLQWLTGIARSYLTYAFNAFFPSLTVGELVRLTKMFKQCVRSVFRVHPPVSSVPLLSALHFPAL